MNDNHVGCVDGGERCVMLTMKAIDGTTRHVAWVHHKAIIQLETCDGQVVESSEVDMMLAEATGRSGEFGHFTLTREVVEAAKVIEDD